MPMLTAMLLTMIRTTLTIGVADHTIVTVVVVAVVRRRTQTQTQVGGVAAHVTELAAALQRRNHEVHIFCRLGAETQEARK